MINYSCYFTKLYTKIKFDPCVKKDAILSGINPNIFPPPEIRSLMPNVKRMKIAQTGVTTKAFFSPRILCHLLFAHLSNGGLSKSVKNVTSLAPKEQH